MYYHIKGLVLRSKISAEADSVITAYTHEWGKISAVVPGAKKIKAKLGWAAEPIREIEFLMYARNNTFRPRVTGAKALNIFPKLFSDWRRFSVAQYCAEIMDSLTPFNSENTKKYELLLRTWQLLESTEYPWRIFSAFVLRFLHLSGYSFVEFLKGNEHLVSKKERELIKTLSTVSGDEVDRIEDMESEAEKNIKQVIDSYLKIYLPRRLMSREFCQKVNFI